MSTAYLVPLVFVLGLFMLQMGKRDRGPARECGVQPIPLSHLRALRTVKVIGLFPESALPHDLRIGSSKDDRPVPGVFHPAKRFGDQQPGLSPARLSAVDQNVSCALES